MTRLSSGSTKPLRMLGFVPGVGTLVAGMFVAKVSVIPAILFFVVGIWTLIIWWKYTLPATDVFIDNESIYKGPTKIKIPFDKVITINQPQFIRYPPVVITYLSESGEPEEILFIPSFEKFFGLFGQRNINTISDSIFKRS